MDKQTILIVDDVELNRAILAELFSDIYHILEAENCREALDILEKDIDQVVMVLLDIVMPVMDGFEVLQEMTERKLIEQVPVILITSENSDRAALQGYQLGVSDIINKPFNPEVVKRRVANVIELFMHKSNLEKLVGKQIETLEKQANKLNQVNNFLIETLSTAVEFRNCESGQHIKRIRHTTQILLEAISREYPEYELSPYHIEKISSASAMHDIGKIAIPDYILNKPGKLTSEEFEIMKAHCIRGCEFLQSIHYAQDEEYFRFCYEICRHHHERWDGNGYPDRLKGDNIPIWAQVVSLADVYDALTSKRVYKNAYSHEKAVKMILDGECGVFNPKLLEVFVKVAPVLERDLASNEEIVDAEFSVCSTFVPAQEVQAKPEESGLSSRTLRLLELEREKYRILSELSGDIVFNYDTKSDVLEFSEKYYDLFHRDIRIPNARDTIERSEVIHPDDRSLFLRRLTELTPKFPSCRIELRMMVPDQGFRWFEVSVNALWNTETNVECVGYLGKLVNIHERKIEANLLRKQANMDSLTELDNRKRIRERLISLFEENKKETGAFFFIDIDNFKAINDNLGHMFGDEILRYIASEIKRKVRSTDIVGRIGGDEFVAFLRNSSSEKAVAEKARDICDLFKNTYKELIDKYNVSCSVGISLFPRDGKSYEELFHHADRALYYAKERGKNGYAFYNETMGNSDFKTVLTNVVENHQLVK